jgi:hypothetical protein
MPETPQAFGTKGYDLPISTAPLILISRLTGGWGCNAMIIREVDGEIDHLKELTPVAKRNTGQHRLSRVPGPIIPLIEVTDDLQEGYEVAVERFGSTLRSGLEARVQI